MYLEQISRNHHVIFILRNYLFRNFRLGLCKICLCRFVEYGKIIIVCNTLTIGSTRLPLMTKSTRGERAKYASNSKYIADNVDTTHSKSLKLTTNRESTIVS